MGCTPAVDDSQGTLDLCTNKSAGREVRAWSKESEEGACSVFLLLFPSTGQLPGHPGYSQHSERLQPVEGVDRDAPQPVVAQDPERKAG